MLAIAAGYDVKTQRIPNVLTFPLLFAGLIVQWALGEGLVYGLMGVGAAFALHFTLWSLSLEGAGDAKLMMAVGAFVGWEAMLEATLWRYILLIPYAVGALTVMKRWPRFMAALQWTLDRSQGRDAGERPEATELPFGPLIALAVPLGVAFPLSKVFL